MRSSFSSSQRRIESLSKELSTLSVKYQQSMEDRKQLEEELIRTGIALKTMADDNWEMKGNKKLNQQHNTTQTTI